LTCIVLEGEDHKQEEIAQIIVLQKREKGRILNTECQEKGNRKGLGRVKPPHPSPSMTAVL